VALYDIDSKFCEPHSAVGLLAQFFCPILTEHDEVAMEP
jgi:hypothetical protein